MITRTSKFCSFCSRFISALTAPARRTPPRNMLAAGRIDEAIAELNGRLSTAPADAESSNLLCRAYYALEDWDRAESPARKRSRSIPDNSRFHLWLGRVYGEKADRANLLAAGSSGRKGSRRIRARRATESERRGCPARSGGVLCSSAPAIVGGGEQKAREQAQSIATVNPAREHWVYARIAEQKKDSATAEREYHQYIDLSQRRRGSLAQPGSFSPPPEALRRNGASHRQAQPGAYAPSPMFWWKRPRCSIAPAAVFLSPPNCCTAISPPVRWRQLRHSKPAICWVCCWKNKETKQAPRRSTVLPCHWPGTSAWPSKRSTELPTEDGEIPSTPCGASQ